MTVARIPDLPVAANQRHRMLVTLVQGRWLAWCNCGETQEFSSFEEGYEIRSVHQRLNDIYRTPVSVASE